MPSLRMCMAALAASTFEATVLHFLAWFTLHTGAHQRHSATLLCVAQWLCSTASASCMQRAPQYACTTAPSGCGSLCTIRVWHSCQFTLLRVTELLLQVGHPFNHSKKFEQEGRPPGAALTHDAILSVSDFHLCMQLFVCRSAMTQQTRLACFKLVAVWVGAETRPVFSGALCALGPAHA